MSKSDDIRAAGIQKFRQTIPAAVARLDWTREQIEAEQTRRLRETLAYAKEHSPFYSERLRGVNPVRFTLADLPKIEPITKADVMEHWDRIVTDPRLTLSKANAHLASLRDGSMTNSYFEDEFYISATGGSSGRRGLFVWDEELFTTTAAVTYRLEAKADIENPPKEPKRTAVICAGSFLHGSRMLFPVSSDPDRQVIAISAGTPISEMVEILNSYEPDRLVSYSSILEELCVEAFAGRLRIKPRRISVNSEPLTNESRQAAQRLWGVNIHNCWGSVEMGVSGVEGDDFDGIILAEDVMIFEAIDESGSIIDSGPADHLLVTRLFGNTFPLIRYEMTDQPIIAAPGSAVAPAYRRIIELKGRSDVWFFYGDLKIHPMLFRGVLGQDPGIIEYQVRQNSAGAEIDLITQGTVDVAELATALGEKLVALGVSNPVLTVRVVDELQRHPETNKLTRFVALKK